MKINVIIYSIAVMALAYCSGNINAQNRPIRSTEMPLKVVEAPEWDEIFRRQNGSGWFSGDGQYSVPFNGRDSFGTGENTKTFWLFSDSRIGGPADPVSLKVTSGKMTKHSVAVLDPVASTDIPTFENMTYYFGGTVEAPTELFGQRLWALDGISIDDVIYMNMSSKDDNNRGVFRVAVPIVNGEAEFTNYNVDKCPYYEAISADHKSHSRLGSALLDLTEFGGFGDKSSPHYGYVYNYGMRKWNSRRGLIVGRVLREDYADFSKWEYWNGSLWVGNDFSVCTNPSAEMFAEIGDRFSVTYITEGIYKGKFLFINVTNNNEPIIEYRFADSPLGPWSDIIPLYAPLKEMDTYGVDSVNFYNAKAHPHLSRDGKLLISYCANVKQVRQNYLTTDKNRGRFIWVDLHNRSDVAPLHLVSQEMEATASRGSDPHFAFGDNVLDSKVWSTLGKNQWLKVDLGQTYYVSRWQVLHQGWIGEDKAGNTRDFRLEKSNDGLIWDIVDRVTGNLEDITDRDFPETSGRYWRLYITEPNSISGSDAITIVNLNIYGRLHPFKSISNDNLCLGKTIVAGGNNMDKHKIVDGDDQTKWELGGDVSNQWFYVDLGSNYLIDRVDLRSGINRKDLEVYNVADFDICFSSDGVQWTKVKTDKYNICNKVRCIFDSLRARYIKVEIKKPQQGEGSKVKIYEFEAFGTQDNSTNINGLLEGNNRISLDQNYPNPFTSTTSIRYTLPQKTNVNLSIYNSLGEKVSTLVDEDKEPGCYQVSYNSKELKPGVYVYSLKAGNTLLSQKMNCE